MKIYLIPGLGFDDRIFAKCALSGFDVHYLNWIEPLKNESIDAYAQRLGHAIPSDQEKTTLIGHSLGGIMSQHIACWKNIHKIILISSIKSRDEMPLQFKLVKPFFLQHFFTKEITIRTVKFWGKSHGYESEEEQDLFAHMVGSHSNAYLQWALGSLSTWKNPALPATTEIVHIHGDIDKTFPIKHIQQPQYTIPQGGHFMIYKQPEVINEILIKELND